MRCIASIARSRREDYRLVPGKSQCMAAHEIELGVDDDRSDNECNGHCELDGHQSLLQKIGAFAWIGQAAFLSAFTGSKEDKTNAG